MRLFLLILTFLARIGAQSLIEGSVVDSVAKAPIPNAKVQVVWLKAPEGKTLIHGVNDQGPTSQTDDAGRFRIEVPAPCEFTLKVEAAGFSPSTGVAAGKWVLKEKESKSDITLLLRPESSLEGRVFDPVLEKPVEGLLVEARERKVFGSGPGHFFPVKSAKTAADGTYRIEGLPAGRYRVSVGPSQQAAIRKPEANPKPLLVYPLTYLPGTENEDAAAELDLAPGARLGGIDIRVSKRKAFRARGKIMRLDGKPLTPSVSFSREEEPKAMSVSYTSLGKLDTPTTFEIGPLNAGTLLLKAHVDGAARRDRAEGRVAITITDKDVDDVILTLRTGVAVTGTLQSEQAKPGQEDPLWAASEKDVMIDILRQGPYRSLDEWPVPIDRANGRWTIEGLPFDPLKVDVSGLPSGYVVTGMSYNGVDGPLGSLQLNEGAIAHEVKVTVARVTNSVHGTVTRESKPAAEAVVVLLREPISQDWKGWRFKFKRTGANGEYLFETLEPGWYRIGAALMSEDAPTVLRSLAASDSPRVEIGKTTNMSRNLKIP